MPVFAAFDRQLQLQRGHLFTWVPMCLGTGIGLYFLASSEPGRAEYGAAGVVILLGALLGRRGSFWSIAALAAALVAAGYSLAGLRSHQVSAPVLQYRYYGPVEGRVVAIDRSSSNAFRVTLDQLRLAKLAPDKVPARVRVSLSGESNLPFPGARVMTTAHLMPPQGPVEPGGFDFRRYAWFKELGGVGYTRVPVLQVSGAGADQRLLQLRFGLSAVLRSRMPGDTGAVAAAITTGDRSGASREVLQVLRASNLAHLLAISGLHMGLLAGFIFGALRGGLALLPGTAVLWPVKKISAAGALAAAAGYLSLSGGSVATERAFVMVSVMLVAVLLDRRALSLRAVAVAAVLVLVRRPESLLSPGFQMSFAATAALVAVFSWIRDANIPLGPRWLRPASALVVSSLVAGLATAPFGAAHFNTVSHYGLLANLLAVPVMGTVVMPAAVLALCLAPLGLEWIGLALMRAGLDWILGVARWVAAMEGVQGQVAAPGAAVLPMFACGALFLILWRGWGRFLGAVPAVLALLLWQLHERPKLLISGSGGLVGVMTAEGRALSRARGQGFAARVWLENDGDPSGQEAAAARWPGAELRVRTIGFHGREIVHVIGKRAAEAFGGCREGQVVVTTVDAQIHGPCLLFGPAQVQRTGSVMLLPDGTFATARDLAGDRLWTREGSRHGKGPEDAPAPAVRLFKAADNAGSQ